MLHDGLSGADRRMNAEAMDVVHVGFSIFS
jgi:hypothetical protein